MSRTNIQKTRSRIIITFFMTQTVGFFQGSTCPVWSVPPTKPPNMLCVLPLHTFGIHCVPVFFPVSQTSVACSWMTPIWSRSRHFYSAFFTAFSWLRGLSTVSSSRHPLTSVCSSLLWMSSSACSYNSFNRCSSLDNSASAPRSRWASRSLHFLAFRRCIS